MITLDDAQEQRFIAKIEVTGFCWNWTAGTCEKGYGTFRLNGKMKKAHRVAYEWLVGDIPPGLVLDHLCRNTSCVNPDHLEPVTNQTNVHRGFGPAARALRRAVCDKCGHDNFEIRENGARRCRICRAQRVRVIRELKKGAPLLKRGPRTLPEPLIIPVREAA